MKVKRFGESMGGKEKWYETDNGERVNCCEDIIQSLWDEWVCLEVSTKAFTDTESVFVFLSPIELPNDKRSVATKFNRHPKAK